MTQKRQIILVVALVIFIGLMQLYANHKPQSITPPVQHTDAVSPELLLDLTVQTVHGDQLNLQELKKAPLVFINVWATWCPPCIEEIPSLKRLHYQYQDKGFHLLGFSVDYDAVGVKDFMKKYDVSYPVVMVSDDLKKYFRNLEGVPTTLIYQKGVLVKTVVGYRDQSFFEQIIQEYLPKGAAKN